MKMLEIINLNQKQCRLENKPFARDSKPQNYKTENSRDSKPQKQRIAETVNHRMIKQRILETVNKSNDSNKKT